jgi:CBS domain-containing protein
MTKRNPPTVPLNISVDELVEDHIMQRDDHAFPVMDGEKLMGIVCLDDVRRVPGTERAKTSVSEIMTPRAELVTLGPDDDASEALQLITSNAVRQLVVLENDELFGLVRRRDIVRFLQVQSDEISSPVDKQQVSR